MPGRTVLTIGNFDGAHCGHAALLRRARAHADAQTPVARVVALVFDPPPLSILRPAQAPALLTTFERRESLLRRAGADHVVRLAPSPELLGLAPAEFIEGIVAEYHPVAIVEGADFRFGRARSGDVDSLSELGRRLNFVADIVAPVEVALSDQTIVTASSTIVRWMVSHGRMRDAAAILGRPHTLSGVVVRGDRRGREIGCPTANLLAQELPPMDGVYAARASLADGRRFGAALHVGPRATFDQAGRTVEAHLLDWPGPLAEGGQEYGWRLSIEIVAWLRDQAKFDSVADLVEQIRRDVARTKQALETTVVGEQPCAQLREAAV